MWLLPVVGVVGAGVVGYLGYRLLLPRSALVVYSDDPQDPSAERGEFRTSAERAAAHLNTVPVPVRSAADLVRAVQSAPSHLGIVVLVGHGTTTKFLSPSRYGIRIGSTSLPQWISERDFARILAPKLAGGAVVSIAGCSAARSPSEPSGWNMATGWHGGADSLAGRLRDALVDAGASGEVRAHVVTGTTLLNPQGRTFYVSSMYAGRPGIHISALAGREQPRDSNDYRDWNNLAQGRVGMGWMLGLNIQDLVGA